MTMSDSMEMFFHFAPIDHLLFKTWQPSSAGALGGACVGIFFFAILERFLAAWYRYKEAQWRIAAGNALVAVAQDCPCDDPKQSPSLTEEAASGNRVTTGPRGLIAPFVLSRELARGGLMSFHSLISYVLMLIVMTFNAGFILSLVIGLGVGEFLVGRVARV